MNKLFFFLVVAILLFLAAPYDSFAFYNNNAPFSEFKNVGRSGSESWSGPLNGTGLPVFNFNETPYLYVKLPSFSLWTQINSTWGDPLANSYDANKQQWLWNGKESWLSLSNWNTVQTPGQWMVDGSYQRLFSQTGISTASFVVTPEPMAFLLYGIGGLPLAAHFIRRRKKSSV